MCIVKFESSDDSRILEGVTARQSEDRGIAPAQHITESVLLIREDAVINRH